MHNNGQTNTRRVSRTFNTHHREKRMPKVSLLQHSQRLLQYAGWLLIAALPATGLAQQAATTEQSSEVKSPKATTIVVPKTTEKVNEKITTSSQQKKTAASNKRFKPSEKISEDLSVAFPVDI